MEGITGGEVVDDKLSTPDSWVMACMSKGFVRGGGLSDFVSVIGVDISVKHMMYVLALFQ
jgi:hypothetical protein